MKALSLDDPKIEVSVFLDDSSREFDTIVINRQ